MGRVGPACADCVSRVLSVLESGRPVTYHGLRQEVKSLTAEVAVAPKVMKTLFPHEIWCQE